MEHRAVRGDNLGHLTLKRVMPPKLPMKPKPAGIINGRYRPTSRLEAATLQQPQQPWSVNTSCRSVGYSTSMSSTLITNTLA